MHTNSYHSWFKLIEIYLNTWDMKYSAIKLKHFDIFLSLILATIHLHEKFGLRVTFMLKQILEKT